MSRGVWKEGEASYRTDFGGLYRDSAPSPPRFLVVFGSSAICEHVAVSEHRFQADQEPGVASGRRLMLHLEIYSVPYRKICAPSSSSDGESKAPLSLSFFMATILLERAWLVHRRRRRRRRSDLRRSIAYSTAIENLLSWL